MRIIIAASTPQTRTCLRYISITRITYMRCTKRPSSTSHDTVHNAIIVVSSFKMCACMNFNWRAYLRPRARLVLRSNNPLSQARGNEDAKCQTTTYLDGESQRQERRDHKQGCRNEHGSSFLEISLTMQRRRDSKNMYPFAVFAETFPVLGVVAILMSGAMNPPMRFSAEQRASPVPR